MTQPGSSHSGAEVSVNLVASVRKRLDDLVMAWARDSRDGKVRYILELGKDERGKQCGCVCISCGQGVLAVNAAKDKWSKRPHFRHAEGPDHPSCIVQSARAALLSSLRAGDLIVLPRQRRSVSVTGLSGGIYEAWIEAPAEPVHIRNVDFEDQLSAMVELEDGRRLKVLVTGTTQPVPGGDRGVVPAIIIAVDSPDLVEMSPDELRRRLVPLIEHGNWCGHWPDPELEAKLLDEAKAKAADALDLDEGDPELPADLRRESLLHREVKAILASASSLLVPGWDIEVADCWGEFLKHVEPAKRLPIRDAILEHRLGRIIPDVIARLRDDSELLVEVTVTNTITDERLDRIRQVNLPTLEIDFSRMGGVVTRARLRQLVLDELAGKHWLHHPDIVTRRIELERRAEISENERERVDSLRDRIRSSTASEWGQQYLRAVRRYAVLRWDDKVEDADRHQKGTESALREVEAAGDALRWHGYPEAVDQRLFDYGHTLLERLLSIQFDTGVGYRFDNAWQVINTMLSDTTDEAKSWHGLYLMAIRFYRPRLNPPQARRVNGWRNKVIASINSGEPTYQRDTRYDGLLALLFPEMAEGLKSAFGKRDSAAGAFQQPQLRDPTELPDLFYEEYEPDRWIWAVTASERVRHAELEASLARLHGISVEPGTLLYELAHSQHASAPALHAGVLGRATGLSRAEVLRYLYQEGYIKLAAQG